MNATAVSFDLLTEPWIPCVLRGGRTAACSLRQTLAEADGIEAVRADSPLVTLAVHRLLLAVLHRVFGPDDFDEWEDLWQAGRWDTAALDEYFNRWADRFDLFDEAHPFYQTPGLVTVEKDGRTPVPLTSLENLFPERAAGSNATLFDHTHIGFPQPIPLAKVAAGLLVQQGLCFGGGQSKNCFINGKHIKTVNRGAAPFVEGIFLLAVGSSLFETLCLNLNPCDSFSGKTPRAGIPIWELSSPEEVVGNPRPSSVVDLYTWQTRRLRVQVAGREGGILVGMQATQGRRFKGDNDQDPLKPYKASKTTGIITRRFREDKDLWRDSAAIFELARKKPDQVLPVAGLELVYYAQLHRLIGDRGAFRLDALGTCNKPGKDNIYFWRHARLPLPPELVADDDLLYALTLATTAAEHAGSALRRAVKVALQGALAKSDDKFGLGSNGSVRDPGGSLQCYWSKLELPFRDLMVSLPHSTNVQADIREWVDHAVCAVARDAYEATAGRLDGGARELRAAVQGRRTLHYELAKKVRPLVTVAAKSADDVSTDEEQ